MSVFTDQLSNFTKNNYQARFFIRHQSGSVCCRHSTRLFIWHRSILSVLYKSICFVLLCSSYVSETIVHRNDEGIESYRSRFQIIEAKRNQQRCFATHQIIQKSDYRRWRLELFILKNVSRWIQKLLERLFQISQQNEIKSVSFFF